MSAENVNLVKSLYEALARGEGVLNAFRAWAAFADENFDGLKRELEALKS